MRELMQPPGTSRLFYGHYIVGGCFLILLFCWGMVLNTFPVFVAPVTQDMGWTRASLAVTQLTGMVTSILLFPIAGKIVDRFGARHIMTVGALILGLALLGGSQSTHIAHFYIMNGFVGVGLTCTTLVPCSFVISNWYVSRRGTAMAVAFVGTATGGMIMSPVAEWIIRNYDWRTALMVAGIEILVLVIPITLFLIRTRPSDMGLEPYGGTAATTGDDQEVWGVNEKEAFRLPVFWLIASIIFLGALVTAGVGFNCVAYLEDVGHSPERATLAWSLIMGAMILGKLTTGPVADRWGSKQTMVAVSILFAVSMVVLTFSQSYFAVMIFVAIYGFTLGAPLILNPLLTGDYLGMKNYGSLFGILNILGTLGGGLGSIGAASYQDRHDTYLPVFYVFAILMLVSAVCSLLISPIPQRVAAIRAANPADVSDTKD